MRMVCISKSNDIAVGLRLAGVESFIIRKDEEILKKIDELSMLDDIAIINVTEKVYEIAKQKLDEITEKRQLPLILKIPNTKD